MVTSHRAETLALVELDAQNTVHLPDDLVSGFHTGDRFVVVRTGDTIVLKRIHPPRITDIVAETPPTEIPMTMDEISELVHDVRRQHTEGT